MRLRRLGGADRIGGGGHGDLSEQKSTGRNALVWNAVSSFSLEMELEVSKRNEKYLGNDKCSRAFPSVWPGSGWRGSMNLMEMGMAPCRVDYYVYKGNLTKDAPRKSLVIDPPFTAYM